MQNPKGPAAVDNSRDRFVDVAATLGVVGNVVQNGCEGKVRAIR